MYSDNETVNVADSEEESESEGEDAARAGGQQNILPRYNWTLNNSAEAPRNRIDIVI